MLHHGTRDTCSSPYCPICQTPSHRDAHPLLIAGVLLCLALLTSIIVFTIWFLN